jgi:hypothetical protein
MILTPLLLLGGSECSETIRAVVGDVSKPAACASDLFDEWVESFGLALAMPLSTERFDLGPPGLDGRVRGVIATMLIDAHQA